MLVLARAQEMQTLCVELHVVLILDAHDLLSCTSGDVVRWRLICKTPRRRKQVGAIGDKSSRLRRIKKHLPERCSRRTAASLCGGHRMRHCTLTGERTSSSVHWTTCQWPTTILVASGWIDDGHAYFVKLLRDRWCELLGCCSAWHAHRDCWKERGCLSKRCPFLSHHFHACHERAV